MALLAKGSAELHRHTEAVGLRSTVESTEARCLRIATLIKSATARRKLQRRYAWSRWSGGDLAGILCIVPYLQYAGSTTELKAVTATDHERNISA